ncbi:MAG: ribonuclease J [Ruminococcaceae bacterium]|nr:ribonuclease J [Oscillospiraceae bacterium]
MAKKKEKETAKKETKKADKGEKLKVIPIGGVDGIGMNMTLLEHGEDLIAVDCGVAFPEDDMPGVDLVIPDFTYILRNEDNFRGLILTHGHEDHIGAVPYLLKQINVPVYGTPLTLGILRLKLAEHGIKNPDLREVFPGETVSFGDAFDVEFIKVNHSIPDAVALCITTPVGRVIHTGDFKIDLTPTKGDEPIDLYRLASLGHKGVKLLMADSTNAEREGCTPSESVVGNSFDKLFYGCEKRIVIATFSSNVHRIQQVINAAVKYGRKVAVTGRSMLNVLKAATELGYMHVPEGTIIDPAEMRLYKDNQLTLLTTGSQGERMSGLYRMANGEHSVVALGANDIVILSASAIPGNEKLIGNIINGLYKLGVEVLTVDTEESVHVSGHACREELKLMHALTKPEFFIPLHGEYKHLCAHASLAREMGMKSKNIMIPENGKIIEVGKRGLAWGNSVPAEQVLVDGYGVGDVGAAVLKDRLHLAEDGIIVVSATVDFTISEMTAGPEIITRGFVYAKENGQLLEELTDKAAELIRKAVYNGKPDMFALKERVKTALSSYIYSKTKKKPIVLPVFTESELY